MPATRRVLDLPDGVRAELNFEKVLDANEGTNIDALISTAESETIVEIKFTEWTFGTARADKESLEELTKVYRPLLAGRLAGSCLKPSTFFRSYQLYRNLAQVRPTVLTA